MKKPKLTLVRLSTDSPIAKIVWSDKPRTHVASIFMENGVPKMESLTTLDRRLYTCADLQTIARILASLRSETQPEL